MNSGAVSNLFGWLFITGGIILALDGLRIIDVPQINSEDKKTTSIVAAVLIIGGSCVAKA